VAEIVIMPKLGFNMEEGKLVKWHKKEGDLIQKGETFFEITTDKTNIEIESTADGVVKKLLVQEGETVPVTAPVAIIGRADEDITELLREIGAEPGGKTGEAGQPPEKGLHSEICAAGRAPEKAEDAPLKLTPRARKLAADQNLKLSELDIKGTGLEGGISERDILRHLDRIKATPVAQKLAAAEGIDLEKVSGTGANRKIMKADVQRAVAEKTEQPLYASKAMPEKEVLDTIPYEGMRKIIGDRLSHSKFTAPHVYFSTPVDVSRLYALRDQITKLIETKVSLNDMIIAGAARALVKNPMLNSSLENGRIVLYKSVNIGVAVALENGLIVPVIKNAHEKKLSEIAQTTRELAAKARAGKLIPCEYNGGTFTVSNLGMYGIEDFTAVINPPEAAILAVSSVRKTPVVISRDGREEIEIRPLMKLTLSVDHRIIDGAVAAKFLNDLKDLLENPMKFLI